MDADRLLIGAQGCDQLAVGGGIRVGVDDGEEVVALALLVTGPGRPTTPRSQSADTIFGRMLVTSGTCAWRAVNVRQVFDQERQKYFGGFAMSGALLPDFFKSRCHRECQQPWRPSAEQ
jgi:hypothetical protein